MSQPFQKNDYSDFALATCSYATDGDMWFKGSVVDGGDGWLLMKTNVIGTRKLLVLRFICFEQEYHHGGQWAIWGATS
jgi:hypothetical protein